MTYALAEGAIIFWWNRAAKGSTIQKLSRDWEIATHLHSALISGKHMNLATVATITVAICALVGPVLQKASTVKILPVITPVRLHGNIAPAIPFGYTTDLYKSDDIYGALVTSPLWEDYERLKCTCANDFGYTRL